MIPTDFDQFAADHNLVSTLPTVGDLPALALPGNGRPIGAFATELGKLLASKEIFVMDQRVFTVDAAAATLELMNPTLFRTWLEQHVSCYRESYSRGELIISPCTITEDSARAVLKSQQFLGCLRRIKRLHPCPMPIIRSDGSLVLLPEGYDAESGTFTAPATAYNLDMNPARARDTIEAAFAEFPFVEDGGRSKAVAIAAMMTIYAGSIMEELALRPAFVYLGNVEGSGKTTVAKLAAIAYGVIDVTSAPKDEAEWDKKLLSVVMSGKRVILFDNVKGHLDSSSLERYISSAQFSGRELGHNTIFTGEACATVLVTGNQLTTTPDMRRRSLFVNLFTTELRAENRHFDRVLDDVALSSLKPDILAACWRIVRSWDEAGRPCSSRINSSFPRWCASIGGIVEHAGFACPTAPAELNGMGDTDTADIMKLGGVMEEGFRYTFQELNALCAEHGIFERFTDCSEDPAHYDRKMKATFSKILKRYDRRHISSGLTFIIEGFGRERRYVARACPALF